MRISGLVSLGFLIAAPLVSAASIGTFSATFPNYSFTAACETPVGGSVIPGNGCSVVNIPYTATGSTSLFANSQLIIQTHLTDSGAPPYLFNGSFTLTDSSNPTDTIFGTLTGAGNPTGPPGPPIGFPPFGVAGSFVTTGGTGAYVGASGVTLFSGTATFETITPDTTFATGHGQLTFTATPEPASWVLASGALVFLLLRGYYKRPYWR